MVAQARWHMVLGIVAALPIAIATIATTCASCRSRANDGPVASSASSAPPLVPMPTQTSTQPSQPSSPPSGDIDDLFRGFEAKLPSPASLSEGNGVSLQCDRHGGVTYTLLAGTAARLPLASDADLPRLVPWARHDDVCIRQIALDAMVTKIGFDRNRVSLPGMHERDHHQYRDILLALKVFLETRRIAFDPKVFDGMLLDITPKDFASMRGHWTEESTGKTFQNFVELDAHQIRVTSKHKEPDPAWPDHTWTTKIKDVVVNERRQYVVSGEWNVESNAKGYQGKKIEPSQFTYAVVPVNADLAWFDEGQGRWIKLRRKTP